MSRRIRVWEFGRCYHVMLRGIDVFKDDRDRSRFCLLLQEASELHMFRIHAFCLMTNHIHLLLEPLECSLANGVHRFATRYAQHYNARHKKRGYVFQGRFKSILVEDGIYMKRLLRYIHLNPLEASLVSTPQDFHWSSHNGYFSRSDFTWLETERVLSYFGATRSVALTNLAEFMTAKIDIAEELQEIRRALRMGVYGSEEFKKAFVVTTKKLEISDDNKNKVASIDMLIKLVCSRFTCTAEQLISEDKQRNVVSARAVLARAAQLSKGLNLSDVSSALKKHPGTISRLATRATKDVILRDFIDELMKSQIA